MEKRAALEKENWIRTWGTQDYGLNAFIGQRWYTVDRDGNRSQLENDHMVLIVERVKRETWRQRK